MVNIRNSIEANRRLSFAILILLLVTMGVVAKFYFEQRSENRALRLKLLSMASAKRNPKPWSQMLSNLKPPGSAGALSSAPATTPPVENNANDEGTTPTVEAPIIEQETHQIASALDANMRNVASLELASLDQNIALADELISREPDSYGAYKAKLISLLVKEGKFKQSLDESEIESVLESMAQFNLGSDVLARREAALLASGSAEIEAGEARLDEISAQKEILEGQISAMDPNAPEVMELINQLQLLEAQENEALTTLTSIEDDLGLKSNQMVSEEMVEIPFMRMLAQGNYEGVAQNAESFINEFPSSPQGYFYLVKSMELQGQRNDALSVIKSAPLSPEDRQKIIERLEYESSQDPREYWKNLNF